MASNHPIPIPGTTSMGISIQVSSRVLNAQMMKELFWHTVATEDTRKLQLIYICISGTYRDPYLPTICTSFVPFDSSTPVPSANPRWLAGKSTMNVDVRYFLWEKKEDFQPIILVCQRVPYHL